MFFNILGGVKCTYVVSTSRCIYTCPISSGMCLRHKWFEWSDLNPSRKRFEFGGLVFSRSDSCPTRENAWSEQVLTSPERVRVEGLSALSPSVNMRAITSAAVIYITHKSHEPIKYGFGGTKINSGSRQKNFNAGKTLGQSILSSHWHMWSLYSLLIYLDFYFITYTFGKNSFNYNTAPEKNNL